MHYYVDRYTYNTDNLSVENISQECPIYFLAKSSTPPPQTLPSRLFWCVVNNAEPNRNSL